MGQILGQGYSAGEKSKTKTTVDMPSDVREGLREAMGVARGGMGDYANILMRGLRGDTGVVDPYRTALAQNAYTPIAGTYAPIAGSYQNVANTFMPGKEAYTAPFAGQMQQAQQQIRRQMPAGGGQMAALAQATTQGGMEMGAARAAQGQRDRDALNALYQEDTRARNAYSRSDIEQLAGLQRKDAEQLMAMRSADEQQKAEMMQNILKLYASLFAGYNPMGQVGSTQESKSPGRLGFPLGEVLL